MRFLNLRHILQFTLELMNRNYDYRFNSRGSLWDFIAILVLMSSTLSEQSYGALLVGVFNDDVL
jgi:hypothetical protein